MDDQNDNKSVEALPESKVAGENSQGESVGGKLIRLGRFQVVFEVTGPHLPLRLSEALTNFQVGIDGRVVYKGRAVVSGLVNAGVSTYCEVSLSETGVDLSLLGLAVNGARTGVFRDFLKRWQNAFRVSPEFKIVVADIHTFLVDFREWSDWFEIEAGHGLGMERGVISDASLQSLAGEFIPAFNDLHEKFEMISYKIPSEQRGAHQNFARRLIQSHFMCSPFGYRAYSKPLGYAGDYEMVNMIMRNPYEGKTVFAKLMNSWLLEQYPSVAHRNRIGYLKETLTNECTRVARSGRFARILNLGCGPAREIEEFFRESAASDYANFTLLDFNDETVADTRRELEQFRRQYGRKAELLVKKKSVLSFLKDAAKAAPVSDAEKYDLIYCAGLFDYLPDGTCRQLMNEFYRLLAPGGLMLATNVDDCKPFRNMLEFILDWHLIYRSRLEMQRIMPGGVDEGGGGFKSDSTAVNVFAEVRKPARRK